MSASFDEHFTKWFHKRWTGVKHPTRCEYEAWCAGAAVERESSYAKIVSAYEAGWRAAAERAERSVTVPAVGSTVYEEDKKVFFVVKA